MDRQCILDRGDYIRAGRKVPEENSYNYTEVRSARKLMEKIIEKLFLHRS